MYFWDSWQAVQEATSGGSVTKSYVYGEGIDEVVKAVLPDAADLDDDLDTSEEVELFYHHNSLGSVVALTDDAGNVVESYTYAPYGAVTVRDDGGAVVSGTQVEQPFMFTGRRWDFEESSGLYYYRLRFYDPIAGRFVSRDPIGMWGDPGQRGNAQSYCSNNPVNLVDPYGLTETPREAARRVAREKMSDSFDKIDDLNKKGRLLQVQAGPFPEYLSGKRFPNSLLVRRSVPKLLNERIGETCGLVDSGAERAQLSKSSKSKRDPSRST